MSAINKAIEIVGGRRALADRLDVKYQAVQQWEKSVPPERVIPIAEATNWTITPHQLRPDLYPNPTDGLPQESAA